MPSTLAVQRPDNHYVAGICGPQKSTFVHKIGHSVHTVFIQSPHTVHQNGTIRPHVQALPIRVIWLIVIHSSLFNIHLNAQTLPFPPRPVIDTLCSPRFLGRGYVKNGDTKAGAWMEGRFQQAGLQPGYGTSYRQPFTHTVNVFEKEPVLKINGKKIELGRWIPDAASGNVKGEFSINKLDSTNFIKRKETGDWQFREICGVRSKYTKPIAFCFPARFFNHGGLSKESKKYFPKFFILQEDKKLTATITDEQLPYGLMRVGPSVQLKNGDRIKLKIKPKLRQHESFNVLARVPGTARPDSILIVSAHYDHLGGLGPRVYFPGANDNASGTAMLLELAAQFAKNPGRYTMLFCAFAGEEAGLLGSTFFVQHPTVPLDKVRFVLNLDLLGSGETGGTLVNAPAVQPDFNLLQAINDSLKALPRLKPRRNAPNSDHYPFAQAGVPAMFLYLEGPYAYYHDVDDRPEGLTLAGFEGTFQLLNRFLQRLQGQ